MTSVSADFINSYPPSVHDCSVVLMHVDETSCQPEARKTSIWPLVPWLDLVRWFGEAGLICGLIWDVVQDGQRGRQSGFPVPVLT